MYDAEFAALYDELYASRDYARQADQIEQIVLTHCPGATSLLDVGCGTGELLAHLRGRFELAGVDVSEAMVAVARAKMLDVPVHLDDLRDFRLDRRFDAIVCIYSPVGYLPGRAALHDGIANLAAHLAPGGVLLVEPWIFPENWNGGDLVHATYQIGDLFISRMGAWVTEGDRSLLTMHYLVGETGRVRHFVDRQELILFARQDYEDAFAAAGCSVEFRPDGYADRGLFIARKP